MTATAHNSTDNRCDCSRPSHPPQPSAIRRSIGACAAVVGQRRPRYTRCAILCLALLAATGPFRTATAQQPPPTLNSFGLDILRGAISDGQSKGSSANTTVLRRRDAEPDGAGDHGQVSLVALVTEDGQRIDKGIVWRIFLAKGPDGKPKLVSTSEAPAPTVRLPAGTYYVNAAFGRANVTRRITVAAGGQAAEQFALNVGLLRVKASVPGRQGAAGGNISFDVLADERDKFGEPTRVITGARPDTLLRLNSGLYHVVSRYGDANAVVRVDLTVEPGKLTEATVVHHAARLTMKLVNRPGGEATPDTQWSLVDAEGDVVKESTGAFPSHTIAPGSYTVTARSQGRVFRQRFTVRSGESKQVEVVMR